MRPLLIVERLRSTYWFVPAMVTLAAVVLAAALVAVDRNAPDVSSWLDWAYGGGAEGARALLSAVAGSTITVVSVTFSVMVVALTVSSQHFGPRLLSSFMRDNVAQLVLGTFTGTFAYCLVVLRTVQSDGEGYTRFVPHLAVTAAVVLTLISVGMLIYYVHHIAVSMQVSSITTAVLRDMERTVKQLYPDPFGEGTAPAVHPAPPMPDDAMIIRAGRSGYLQSVDAEPLMRLLRERNTVLWLTVRPGEFVIAGQPIGGAHPPPQDSAALERGIDGTLSFGADRSPEQDADFAVQQLVEMALRALSPGVNEPFTAITCIDRLGQGLAMVASRTIPSALRTDPDGSLRMVAQPRTFVELAHAAFEPIAIFAGRNPAIAERLLDTLATLGDLTRRAEDRQALATLADFVRTTAARELRDDEAPRRAVERRYQLVRSRLRVDGTLHSRSA